MDKNRKADSFECVRSKTDDLEAVECGSPAHANGDRAIPSDNGRRASFDRSTGEVRGSGVGAGGGSTGEDLASDSAAGDGFPFTGGASKP
jgi:hypothetical protein